MADSLKSNTSFLFASDLDGTLIPARDEHADAAVLDLFRTRAAERDGWVLAYVTGRSRPLTLRGCTEHGLPEPDWIVGDVGASMHARAREGWRRHEPYLLFLEERTRRDELDHLHAWVAARPGVREQPPDCQSRFKHSFFLSPGEAPVLLEDLGAENARRGAPATVIHSVDAFTGEGLLDLMPAGVSKASAVAWLQQTLHLPAGRVVYAGDSGNDLEAFAGPWASILVSNTPEDVKRRAVETARTRADTGELYLAERPCIAGVVEGLAHFGVPGFEP